MNTSEWMLLIVGMLMIVAWALPRDPHNGT